VKEGHCHGLETMDGNRIEVVGKMGSSSSVEGWSNRMQKSST
jgi:hypothetical protein